VKAKAERPARSFALRTFENYHEGLHRFLLRRLRSAHDASDVMQEVFLRVLQLERTEVVRNPKGYLYGIASHVVQEFRSRISRDRVTFDSLELERSAESLQAPQADELPDAVGIEREVQNALARLPPIQLRILIARQRDGLSYPEIAQSLGLSTHTVRKYMDRALASVRSQLALRPSKSEGSEP
jgi:RNA polymerase sigma factor (sigma-70 family)